MYGIGFDDPRYTVLICTFLTLIVSGLGCSYRKRWARIVLVMAFSFLYLISFIGLLNILIAEEGDLMRWCPHVVIPMVVSFFYIIFLSHPKVEQLFE